VTHGVLVTRSAEPNAARVDDSVRARQPAIALGGREELIHDLNELLRPESPPALLAIVFFDGFTRKTRRHGDRRLRLALMARCATVAHALGPAATCYRLREAEFAALIRATADEANRLLAQALAQVEGDASEDGGPVAFGSCLLPREAGAPVDALGLAGKRLTDSRRGREARETDAVLPARTAEAG
jgi:GGDEF domain-containing protein